MPSRTETEIIKRTNDIAIMSSGNANHATQNSDLSKKQRKTGLGKPELGRSDKGVRFCCIQYRSQCGRVYRYNFLKSNSLLSDKLFAKKVL